MEILKKMRLTGSSEFEVKEKLESLGVKMRALVARQADVCSELENAELMLGKVRKMEVVHWLEVVNERKDESQSIEEEFQRKGRNSSKPQRIQRIQIITDVVQQLLEQGKFSNGLVRDDHKARSVLFPVENLVGELFEKNVRKVREDLENPQTFLIGVHGMGGVGKTTLLKHINNYLKDNSDIYWVTVSADCSLYQLQQKIYNVITSETDIEEKDVERRAAKLHYMLGKMEKVVLILDDVWKPLMLDKVGVGAKNCKIIMSSRSEDVCRKMGCSELVKVQTLSEDEAWQLFVDYLLDQNYRKLTAEMKQIAALVAEECSGLPLAIIAIAASLRGVFDIREWKDALDDLRNPNRVHNEMENEVIPKLKISYDRLNDKLLQSCFLSCVLYPEDQLIRRKELIDLWRHEGLLDGIDGKEEQINKGHTILNKLVSSCLLETGLFGWDDSPFVKMHDLVRDMGINTSGTRFIAKSRLLVKEVPEEELWTKDLEKVSLRENKIEMLPRNMSPFCPQLTVLILCQNPLKGIPESFFEHTTALTVLDLSWTDIERVPEGVSHLENLRALKLHGCRNIKFVPSLAKLSKLRVLQLPEKHDYVEAPEGIETLKYLETLTYCRWNNSSLSLYNTLIESCIGLCNFHLSLSGDTLPYFDWLENMDLKATENQVLVSGVKFEAEERITILLPNTTQVLCICDSDLVGRSSGNVFRSSGNPIELKVLGIERCRNGRYIFSGAHPESSVFGQVGSLEALYLSNLPELEGIIELEGFEPDLVLPSQFHPKTGGCMFVKLKSLSIEKCPKLKVVFQANLLQQQKPILPNLVRLSILECENLEEIFASPIAGISPIIHLPKLKRFTLSQLPKLGCIYRGVMLCRPYIFKIEDCPKLKMLELTDQLWCDASPSTLASIQPSNDHGEWWEPLYSRYPYDADRLSRFVSHIQSMGKEEHLPLSLFSSVQRALHQLIGMKRMKMTWKATPEEEDDNDNKSCEREWGAYLSLSSL